ncbi:hypothetical protein P280DRAFT_264730 [Massarina eburnea CBS 473.64]|uniref:Uncharacterized protein n=1 Tax=Massarina eburnea CBS 473.64 TaxID=1395130 RepID=A0A6A6S5H0_9PLEO|nr:hypothetical protein P280DRAFT_264730 [Massarina eburnea CBS 473.64]
MRRVIFIVPVPPSFRVNSCSCGGVACINTVASSDRLSAATSLDGEVRKGLQRWIHVVPGTIRDEGFRSRRSRQRAARSIEHAEEKLDRLPRVGILAPRDFTLTNLPLTRTSMYVVIIVDGFRSETEGYERGLMPAVGRLARQTASVLLHRPQHHETLS